MLIEIDAPHFYAGVILDEEGRVVVRAAPIVKYMIGWERRKGDLVHCPK